jgi:hypothetical protein
MNRRDFFIRCSMFGFLLRKGWRRGLRAETLLPQTLSHKPLSEPHFPSHLHLFVWRNWELVNIEPMARVLRGTPKEVLEIGYSMGLPKKPHLTDAQLRRTYTTVIRQNWHILPDEQLIQLLSWDRAQYEHTLREDDALWYKFGEMKPDCETLIYESPSAQALERAAEIKLEVHTAFGRSLDDAGESPCQFVVELSTPSPNEIHKRGSETRALPHEVDLSRGWTMQTTTQAPRDLLPLVEDFRTYLRSAFDCELRQGDKNGSESRILEISIDPTISEMQGSHTVDVQQQAIRVVGQDLTGVRLALDDLQGRMEARGAPFLEQGEKRRIASLSTRFLYPYFALYGDPLMQMEQGLDPLPDGYLQTLVRLGINGVWLQAVLHNLAPSRLFPEFGGGWETRLRNLDRLVERAKRYGLKIYLYVNEPRSQPEKFFAHRLEMKGTYDPFYKGYYSMCTSAPEVRQWISYSFAHIFSQVSELGGVFIIAMSENATNCYARGLARFCPRCSKRQGWQVVSEVVQTIHDGVRRSSRRADVIFWDWGLGDDWIPNGAAPEEVIPRLPTDVILLSTSEWDLEINRGGFPGKVAEYSISVVGPGPRASNHWEMADHRKLRTMAKVAFNNTWEISAVPYIPVLDLIALHCENLTKAGISGLMLSWTLGGFPSPNLELASEYYFSPTPDSGQALLRTAARRYGQQAALFILEAWKAFSAAFQEFPYGVALYLMPTQIGPANLLRLDPTGYKAGVLLVPYDDYKGWAGPYPVEVVQGQFEKMATGWDAGLERFRKALLLVPRRKLAAAQKDLGVAETCYLHFKSVANQIRFYMLRQQLESVGRDNRSVIVGRMASIANEETQLARRQYVIAKTDSTIAYEATNHYYYRPLDLVEKVLNCNEVMRSITTA